MDINLNQKRLPPPVNIQISYPKIQGHSLITWNMIPKQPNISQVFYNIYRGISPNGIFYKLNNAHLATNAFEDKTLGNNPNVSYYYKVSTVYLIDTQVIEGPLSSPVSYQVNNTNRWFAKMNERNLWILKNTGQLFDYYARKYEGKRCPVCYSDERGRASDPACPVCWGTGFEGGYEPMFQLYIRQKPVDADMSITPQGYVYNNAPGAWTISTVQINDRDLLINPQGKFFQVTSSQINQVAGYLFHQELKLKEYDPTDPIYRMTRTSLHPNL